MTQDKLDNLILQVAHRRASLYRHTATGGQPKYLFTEQHLLDFVHSVLQEMEKPQPKQPPPIF